jgi:hypothetical protein
VGGIGGLRFGNAGSNGSSSGGGADASGALTLGNSIVATNTGTFGRDVNGNFTSNGTNFIGVADDATLWDSTDLLGDTSFARDPELLPIGNYGGPTETMPPLATGQQIEKQTGSFTTFISGPSPVLNKGTNSLVTGITSDQRGLRRIFGTTVDIGAVEVQSA